MRLIESCLSEMWTAARCALVAALPVRTFSSLFEELFLRSLEIVFLVDAQHLGGLPLRHSAVEFGPVAVL